MNRALSVILVFTAPLLLTACPSLVVSAGAEVATTAMENRSAGRKVDDKLLYADVYNQFTKADRSDLIKEVNLNTRFARLMLTGTVKSEADAQKAVELAWKAKNVEEIINELVIDPNKSFYGTANDSLVKRNLEARLLITKEVWVINYSLDIQNGVAYIIGRVKNQGELDRVLNVCRTTRGVKRVISHLQINPNTGLNPSTPSATSGADSMNSSGNIAPIENMSGSAPKYDPYSNNHVVQSGPISQDSTRSGGSN